MTSKTYEQRMSQDRMGEYDQLPRERRDLEKYYYHSYLARTLASAQVFARIRSWEDYLRDYPGIEKFVPYTEKRPIKFK